MKLRIFLFFNDKIEKTVHRGKQFETVDCKINPNAVRTKKISFL